MILLAAGMPSGIIGHTGVLGMSHDDADRPLQAVYVLTHDYERPESGYISSGCDHVYGDEEYGSGQLCGQGIERHQDWRLYRHSSGAWYRLDGNV